MSGKQITTRRHFPLTLEIGTSKYRVHCTQITTHSYFLLELRYKQMPGGLRLLISAVSYLNLVDSHRHFFTSRRRTEINTRCYVKKTGVRHNQTSNFNFFQEFLTLTIPYILNFAIVLSDFELEGLAMRVPSRCRDRERETEERHSGETPQN